jgi:CRISPR-associated protein Csm1
MNIKNRQKIVLAALLHDIGKFWERADEKYYESETIKSEFPNGEYGHTVPLYDNKSPKYGHALWTQTFFNIKYNGNTIGQQFDLDKEGDLTLATLSARHHKPTNALEGIISLADKWSSSIDRPDEGEEGVEGYGEIKNKWGSGFNKKVPLQSIFDQILVKEQKGKTNAFSLEKLNVLDDKTIYAKNLEINKNEDLTSDYKKLWDGFKNEFVELMGRCKDFDSFYISLCDILRNYTWCIPSATNVDPCNVSLFEHLKTTAGIALCLYDYYEDRMEDLIYKGDNAQEEDSLLMLCIDITGIQKFIYDIASKKAAKSLKGRSFYLQLYMSNIIDRLLGHKDIQAYTSNIIYASGGKAYIILPNLDRIQKAINELDKQIQEYLWHEFQGKIYAVFGSIAFGYKTTYNQSNLKWENYVYSSYLTDQERNNLNIDSNDKIDLGDLWRIVSDRAAQKKNRKFEEKVFKYSELFNPRSINFNLEKCQVTGVRSKDLKDLNEGRDKENTVMVLNSVYEQSKLGEKLKEGNQMITYYDTEATGDINIENISYKIDDRDKILKLSGTYKNAIINRFNSTESLGKLNNVGIRTLFYGGNKQPLNADRAAKTFEELAMIDDWKSTKLGILRMDVDNLGQIFIKGFDNKVQKKSFAAYSTLSFLLEAFFCGHINHIQQSNDLFKNYVQILYSGGDDLFAIGRWDTIIDFAAKVRSEFKRFVCRDDITISGGIAIVGAKYPIMKSAELAGDMEKSAKEFNGNAKNAINFFGETVSWDKEFDFVKGAKDSFVHFDGEVSRALLQTVQQYKLIKDDGIKKEREGKGKRDMSYIWHSAYSITRTLDRLKDNQIEAISFVDSIRRNILHNEEFGSERYLDLLALGARWAEYILKIKKQN